MSNLETLYQTYPDDLRLQTPLSRDVLWLETQKLHISDSVSGAIKALGIDAPWEEVAKDPLKIALADTLWSTTLACFGPKLTPDLVKALNIARFGSDYLTNDVAAHVFTGNHLSVSCRLIPVTSDGNRGPGPVLVHHMPTFASVDGGKPAIGDVSPITLEKHEGQFVVSMTTPSGHIWTKALEVLPAKANATTLVGKDQAMAMVKSIASPCVSAFGVLILRPDCQENCIMCTVPRGNGAISQAYQEQVSGVLDLLVDDAALHNHAFQQTFTGGSLAYGDGGFMTAHAWGMELLASKIAAKEHELGKKIPVQIQLEMVLPDDQSTWPDIVDTLAHYTKDLGWNISLAINMEVIQDAWKGLFLQGSIKSVTTLEDHVAFAQAVKHKTHNAVQINSLVMFGMKPKAMDDSSYMAADLAALQQLIGAGIKPDYQPVKIESNSVVEAYPVPNPVLLMLQDAALKQMIAKAKLPRSPGCVGGCNACDQSHETNQLLAAAKKAKVSLPDVFAPLFHGLGKEYEMLYKQIFSSPVPASPIVLYEASS